MSRPSSVEALVVMNLTRPRILGAALAAAIAVVGGCNAKIATVLGNNGSGANDGSDGGSVLDNDRPLVPATKVDLLFVVDNSRAMGDKSKRLAASIGTLLRGVAAVGDVHVGVISSSLGNFGGDVCDENNPEANGRAHLRTIGPDGNVVPGAETGVLSYAGGSADVLVSSTEALIRGAGATGCGLEAQLESMYRFLVQPDPWERVTLDQHNQADLGSALDLTVLTQRKAFLRPDSALVVVMVTDEDDSSADPLSVNGQGWAFMARNFPGSHVFRGGPQQGTTAPRGTSTCGADPASAACTSCGLQETCDTQLPECQQIKNDPNCREPGNGAVPGSDGYYGPTDDELNVRFQHMKERYGVDPQFPLARYIDGLTLPRVPDRGSEHAWTTTATGSRKIAEYTRNPKCTNPIFAADLPSVAGDELCALPRGARSRELVLFAVLGGVPKELVTGDPDWTKIIGANPDNYDLAGIDLHMLQSVDPRPGLSGPPAGPYEDGGPPKPEIDPIHGREYTTHKSDLQYACIFALPAPRTCSGADPSCECPPDWGTDSPVCESLGVQVRAKAYPSPRPLRVVRALGQRGIVGSVCADSYEGTLATVNQRLDGRVVR